MTIDLSTMERTVRRALLHAINIGALLMIGQYMAVSALASAEQEERASEWARRSGEHADALRRFQACTRRSSGVIMATDECVAEAASAPLRQELASVIRQDVRYGRDIPAPLRWFLQ